jgi:hypothetical protein
MCVCVYVCAERVFTGCWEEVLFDMKIQVERCGCNSATSLSHGLGTLAAVALAVALCLL